MAISIAKTQGEIQELPLVELAFEILKSKKEPFYFRDLMNGISELRGMTEEQVMDVIAQLYTEINIDGRFVCIGQNVWGLKRWYPVDKTAEKAVAGKKFIRKSSGDAFGDDDEDLDDFDEDVDADDLDDSLDALGLDDEDADHPHAAFVADPDAEEEDADYSDDDEDADNAEEELVEDDSDDEEEED